MKSPWVTTQQAAEYLGFSRSTITHLARSGELKASQHCAGAEYRFKIDWLDAFMESKIKTNKHDNPKLRIRDTAILPDRLIAAKQKARLKK